MSPLEPVGIVQGVDGSGFLINPASVEAIVAPWDALVAAAIEAYRRHLGEDLHSVYVRGSVSQGKAIADVSDLDSFCVTHGLAEGWWDRWGRDARNALEDRFAFCAEVELDCLPKAALLKEHSYRWARFHIKTQAACVFGEDVGRELDPIRPGVDAMVHAPHLHGRLERFRRRVEGAWRDKRVRLSGRVMKFMVRSGFDIVMERERSYTRDLVRCAEAFGRHYPEQAADMHRALKLAIEPTGDAVEALSLVDGLGAWLVSEASGCIGESPT